MATKEALDVINAAIDQKVEKPAEPAKDEDTDGDTDDTDTGTDGDDAGESQSAGATAPDTDTGRASAADAGADGKDTAAAGKKDAGAGDVPVDGKPGAAAAQPGGKGEKKPDDGKKPDGAAAKKEGEGGEKPKAPAKEPDHLNDPIDSRLKETTQTRIRFLIDTVKERDTEVAQGRELFQSISSTGMSGEELGTMLTYARLVHSDKVEDKRTAFNFLQAELRGLALQLGETSAGVDFLADHPDLKERVEAGTLTDTDARELVLSRERTKANEAAVTRQNETEQEAQAAHAKGNADLTELGRTLQAMDPLYTRKMTVLGSQLKAELSKLHPTKWVEHVRKSYAEFKLPAAPPAPNNGGTPPAGDSEKPQPLRPNKQPSGDGAKQPTSAREALDAALGSMGA